MKDTIYKNSKNGILLGVCAGLGERFGFDSTIVRLLWIVFGLTGFGIVVYFILGLLLKDVSEL